MAKHIKSKHPGKPTKPYPEFPLTPHPSGRWCKKFRGKLHYFGKTSDPWQNAFERYQHDWPAIIQGRRPEAPIGEDGCTLRVLCNAFLNSKKERVDNGELSPRTFRDAFRVCEVLIDHLGRDRQVDALRPEDFSGLRASMAKTRNLVSLKDDVNRARGVFKFAFDERLIDKPVRYGQSFQRPTKKNLRRARHEAGPKVFSAGEVNRILDALDGKPIAIEGKDEPVTLTPDPALKAMVLLGLNCGFGNTDVATLPQTGLDFKAGWVDFPRPKTWIHRRVALWPETLEALRVAIAGRPEPKDQADAGLIFLTRQGRPWVRVQPKRKADNAPAVAVPIDAISQRFRKVLKAIGVNGHRGFYTLRHCTETIGGEAKDQVAVDFIMGHCDESMADAYREGISDARLKAVVDTVRGWLKRGQL
jgi:integrase